jgi:ABC-type transport system substrate-binding protein
VLLNRIYGIIVLCILLSSVMMGCIDQQSTQKLSQTLTIGYGRDTNIASPQMMDFMPEMMVLERLIEYRDGEVLPSLATSWDIQDNGKTIVFHLKKDIKFSDGSPFTAEDVKFTFDRLKALKYYHWTEVDRIKSIEVIDPHTIAFHYEDGKEGYIALTAFGEYHNSIMSPVSVEPKGNISGKIVNPIGTGQWKVDEYVKDQYTIFVRNENYHGEKSKLDKIIVKDIPDAETRVLALRSHDVDMIVDYYHGGSSYTPRNLLEPLKSEGFNVIKNEMPMTTIINFNYKKEPWNDVGVRKAVNYAIDNDEVSALFDGWVNPAKHGLYSEQGPYIKEAQVEAYPNDLNEAETLLKNAGYGELKADLILQGENPDEVKLGELIQAQLKKIGIQVKLSVLEGGAYSERWNKGDYDLRVNYIGGPERRSYTRTDGRFNPNASEFGYGAYDDPELTDVLEKAVSSFDGNERQEDFKQFYQLLHEKAGVVPLYYDAVFIVADKKVKGIKYVSSEPCFSGVWIE